VTSVIGHRIHVVGPTCSGKSTLASQLAAAIGAPFVDMDGLNWLPGWVGLHQADPEELQRRVDEVTAGDAWVVGGIYSPFCERAFWSRLETLVWLDLPPRTLIPRVVRRSWKRMRSSECLWGTNYEQFWPQLKIWDAQSLLRMAVTQPGMMRRRLLAAQADPRAAHIRFIRLTSPHEVREFRQTVEPRREDHEP